MAPHFTSVIATDASARQIQSAGQRDRIEFRVAPADDSGLEPESVDLVTVAQALHWFDIPAFFEEASRVLKPNGVLAAWCYHHCGVNADIDAVFAQILAEGEEYWPPERNIVENHYRGIAMPFAELEATDYQMTADWKCEDLMDYMRTWSASQRYMADMESDPIAIYADTLRSAWGEGRQTVRWPLILRAGRKSGA